MIKAAPHHRRQAGFTLVELMVVVAIIGILAAVALPAYNDYIRRGQVTEAVGALSDYRIKMEQYFQDHRNYGATNCADATGTGSWNDFASSGSRYFEFSCTLASVNGVAAQGYVVTATGRQGRAVGNEYSLTQDNRKSTSKFKGENSTAACWLLKGDEC
jgi:type IV pilus assembly protein PilE